jgi:hypothetical protein
VKSIKTEEVIRGEEDKSVKTRKLSGFVAKRGLEHTFILLRHLNARSRGNAEAGGLTLTTCAPVASNPETGRER